jgi:hypothetical protein
MTGSLAQSYVVIFDGIAVPELTDALERLDSAAAAMNWMVAMPHTVFVVSKMNASDLASFLRQLLPGIDRLIVLNAQADRGGRLPQTAWDFLNHPAPRGG